MHGNQNFTLTSTFCSHNLHYNARQNFKIMLTLRLNSIVSYCKQAKYIHHTKNGHTVYF